jgi:tRNA (cytidine32/uridine32-2'-O)-methyltransferase
MASGAEDILEKAEVVSSLDEALVGCQLILGTSARERYLNWPLCNPKQAADIVFKESVAFIALVFGRERTGLTNLELQRCHYHVNIPTNPDYSSLNVASAVQVIAYELYAKSVESVPLLKQEQDALAPDHEVERLYQHLEQTLIDIDFLNPAQPKFLMWRLRRLFQRARLEQQEVNILRGICRAAQEKKA